ncbi:MAG: Holliday junction resolvase RuvX [Acidobacteria bacterium]|nr:Holliday junction resolvase RuvX [Acidobacteriota bacterium]
MGRVMALDWGEVRIGVALSDPLRLTSRALTTLTHRDAEKDTEAIRRIIEEHDVVEVIVGHPVHTDGGRGRVARAAEQFAERLRANVEVPVLLWDERFTTQEAARTLIEMNVKRRQRDRAIDRFAAALILQGFLEFERQQSAGVAGDPGRSVSE